VYAAFGWPFVKRFALCHETVVCLSCPVCNVGILWSNGWTDQYESWHAGKIRPWPHCFRWGSSSPPPKGYSPQFAAHICCRQMAGWIKIPLGMEVGLGPVDFLLNGHRAPLNKKGAEPPTRIFRPCPLRPSCWMDQDGTWHGGGPWCRPNCARWGPSSTPQKGAEPTNFRPICIAAKRLDASIYHFHGCRPQPRPHCVRWEPSSPPLKNGAEPPIFGPFLLFSNSRMHQDATWYGGTPLTRRLCVRWGPDGSPKRGQTPNFRPMSIVAKRLDGPRCHIVPR